MAANSKTIGGVTFAVINGGVKAETKGKRGTFLAGVDLETATAVYASLVQQALDHYGPRFRAFPGKPLDEELLEEVAADATLYAMYLDSIARRPFQVSGAILDGTSVRRMVQHLITQTWPRNKKKAAAVTAQLFGLTPEQYADWLMREQRFMDNR